MYFFVYGVSLIITRIYAAVTIKYDGWGTRGSKERKRALQKREKKRLVAVQIVPQVTIREM